MSDIVLPSRWSYSSLSTWKQCPRKWHAQYVEKIKSTSIEADRGSVAHKALEDFAAVPANERSLEVLMELCSAALNEYDGEFASTAFSKMVTDRVRNAWHLERWTAVPATYVEMELSMVTPMGRTFRGFADRVDEVKADGGSFIVTDYKSGKPSPWSLASYSKQAACYVAMLRAAGMHSNSGRIVCLGKGVNPSNILRFTYSDADIDGIVSWIDSTVTEIETFYSGDYSVDELATNGSPLCNWCPVKDICPGPKDAGIKIKN